MRRFTSLGSRSRSRCAAPRPPTAPTCPLARRGRIAYAEAVGFRDKAAGASMPVDAIFRMVGNILGISGASDDRGAAERAGWRFIQESEFAKGVR